MPDRGDFTGDVLSLTPTDFVRLDTPEPAGMKSKTHFLTLVVEDYYHSSALSSVISPQRWERFDTRIESSTRRVMDLLDRYDTKATFFVLGWVAERVPELIGEIAARGHEVASKGYDRRPLVEMNRDEFRQDVRRSKQAIERATGFNVLGYRLGRGSLGEGDLWALDVLAEEGYRYDSSVFPQFRSAAKRPLQRFPYLHRSGDLEIVELPLSSFGHDNWLLRVAGGNYMRQVPNLWWRQVFRHWHERYESPFNLYLHVWEFDPEAPRITGARWLSQVRQYRNLTKVPQRLEYLLDHYQFGSIADVMEWNVEDSTAGAVDQGSVNDHVLPSITLTPSDSGTGDSHKDNTRKAITIVVPCYNERPGLGYLARTLSELDRTLCTTYDLKLLFVDDGSTDGTAEALHDLYAERRDVSIFRHTRNQGVAAATLTGIHFASTEIVCVIDADCTYDPHQLANLIPALTDSVDLVTASPYHPQGKVRNVPRWRLFLSKGASTLYRLLLKNKLHTYTSCFRVYRKSAVDGILVEDGRFLGITEILWQLDQRGSQIVECPAVLEVRVLGTSKLNTLHGIASHLRLLARVARQRLFGTPPVESSLPQDQPTLDTPYEVHHVSHIDDYSGSPYASV